MSHTASLGAEEILWQAVLQRDANFDGLILYGVRSTKIYCRPTCPSRKPNRHHVCFFDAALAAEAAGYRACKRCNPQHTIAPNSTLAKILAVCRYLDVHIEQLPTLAELGQWVGMSPAYLQRSFKQTIGVAPFQYADARRMERFKQRVQGGETITDALYATGYGASSRLYAKAPKQLGMTPAAYQHFGQGESIRYTIVQSPLGWLLVAATRKGICSVRLGETESALEQELRQEFKNAQLQSDDPMLQQWIQSLSDYINGLRSIPTLPVDVQATAFQLQVWQALQAIPVGMTASYSKIAHQIGQPTSVRAVARACATNPVALVVPCHRVIQKDGGLGGYRWGIERKQNLLDLEAQLSSQAPSSDLSC